LKKHDFHSPRTNKEWFLYYLYNDPQFIEEKGKINNYLKTEYSELGELYGVIFLNLDKESICSLLIEKIGKNNKGVLMIQAMAKKFEVSTFIIEQGLAYVKNLPLSYTNQYSSQPYLEKIKDNKIAIYINSKTRLKDIESIWFIVQEKQRELSSYTPQSKASTNPSLVYAIYKQRLPNKVDKRLSFEKIFINYQNGTLPDYRGSTTQFNSSDSLERYYHKHMPKTDAL